MSNLMVLPKEAELPTVLREHVVVCEEVDYATFHHQELLSMWCDREDGTYVLQENMVVVDSHGQTKYHHYHRNLQLGLDDYNLDDDRTSWIEPIFAIRDNDDGPRRVIADAGQEASYCPQPHSLPLPRFVSSDNVACQQGAASQRVQVAEAQRSRAGSNLKRQIREFWNNRGLEGTAVQKEIKHIQALLFRRKKYAVSPELWFPDGSDLGEEQHVEAVVSDVFVLNQIKEVIELRETWLRQRNLPMDFQILDQRRKKNFVVWAKNKFHEGEHQQALQEQDFKQGGETEVRHGRNLRWNSELERRLGTAAFWHMIRVSGSYPRTDRGFLGLGGSDGKRY